MYSEGVSPVESPEAELDEVSPFAQPEPTANNKTHKITLVVFFKNFISYLPFYILNEPLVKPFTNCLEQQAKMINIGKLAIT